MHRRLKIAQLVVFILVLNILLIVYYSRNTPTAAPKTDHNEVVRRFISKYNIRTKAYTQGSTAVGLKTPANRLEELAISKHLEDKSNKSDFVNVARNVFVYSAYFDERKDRFVRFVSVAHVKDHNDLLCKFEENSKRSVLVTNATFYGSCETHGLTYGAFLISCPVPNSIGRTNIADNGVFLISNGNSVKFEQTTHFNVEVPTSSVNKYDFSVCVPPLYGDVPAAKIIEFIEVTTILGANHFIFYDNAISKTLLAILRSFNHVTIKPWKHSFGDEELWYKGQSASIWDCMFHNMYSSNYLVFNDIDEYIVPRITNSWNGLMDYSRKRGTVTEDVAVMRFKSFVFDNSRVKSQLKFSNDTQQYVTLNTVIRSRLGELHNGKMIVNPRKVFELGIHHLSRPLEDRYIATNVRSEVAIVHHYRKFENVQPIARRKGKAKGKNSGKHKGKGKNSGKQKGNGKGKEKKDKRPSFIEDLTMWRYYSNITSAISERQLRLRHLGIDV